LEDVILGEVRRLTGGIGVEDMTAKYLTAKDMTGVMGHMTITGTLNMMTQNKDRQK